MIHPLLGDDFPHLPGRLTLCDNRPVSARRASHDAPVTVVIRSTRRNKDGPLRSFEGQHSNCRAVIYHYSVDTGIAKSQ